MARNIPPIAILLFARQPPIHAIEEGNTVLVVEHHLYVIKWADWVINLGGGGESGGHIIAESPPETIANSPKSITGKSLKPLLALGR